ncbi:MAG: hypothetical protein IT269_04130 [Saprospiraceae bacterium]|nr:hypothetical protein [Saprospiraceae bacterium]
MKMNIQTSILLLSAFLFRLWYGTGKFLEDSAFQNFLTGLRNYCSGHTDWWGPGLPWLDNRIPGALQGLLVSVPLHLYAHPMSVVLALNILTFLSLTGLGWYLSKRVPNLPSWLIYAWVLLMPWSLQYTCHPDSLAYALVGATMFFLGIIELGNIYQERVLPASVSFFMAGFGLVWVMQLHPAWGLLTPFIPLVVWINRREKTGILFMLAGALTAGLTYLPWLMNEGFQPMREAQLFFGLHTENAQQIPTLIYHFFASATTDLSAMMGSSMQERQQFILGNGLAGWGAMLLMATAIVMVGWLIGWLFRGNLSATQMNVNNWPQATVLWLLVGVCFLNSPPDARSVFLFLPVSIWYAMHAAEGLATTRYFSKIALGVLLIVVAFHAIFGLKQHEKTGLQHAQKAVNAALQNKNYALAGARPWSKPERDRIALSKVWTPKAGTNGEACYTTGFEYQNEYFKPANVTREKAFKGQYAQRLDSVNTVGLDFNILNVKDLKGEISGTMYLYYQSTENQQVNMNVFVQASGQAIPMGSWPVAASSDWKMFVMDIQYIRGLIGDGEIQLTIEKANPHSAPLYIDDVEICLH